MKTFTSFAQKAVTSTSQFLASAADKVTDAAAFTTFMVAEAYKEIHALNALCIRYGWCFTPDFPFQTLFTSALQLKAEKRPKHVLDRLIRDHLIRDNFQQLRAIVTNVATSPALGLQRSKILADCLRVLPSHGIGRFNAANLLVPTLMTVIDGVIGDFARRSLSLDNWHVKNGKPRVKAALRQVAYAFDEPAFDLIFDVVFSTAWGSQTPASGRRFNRHNIVHGNWLAFGRMEYVLRAFLIISFLCYIIDEYQSRGQGHGRMPITLPSQYSWLLSENPLAGFQEMAADRLAKRGIEPPTFNPVRIVPTEVSVVASAFAEDVSGHRPSGAPG
jgi:hypothetical protein